jgi:CRP-like cAMP-binding protein
MACTISTSPHFPCVDSILKQIPLFSGVSDALVAQFHDAAHVRAERKGKVLFIQGDQAKWFYVVVHGWVKLFRETIDGAEAIIDICTHGHMFGEHALFEDEVHGCSAQLVEDAQLVMLPISMLKNTIAENSQLALNMLTGMSRHRSKQAQEIEHLSLKNAPQRIGCFLLRLCPDDAGERATVHLPYDKTLVAARLGMKPETFSRALARLKGESLIAIQGASVTICNVDALVRYTCDHCSSTFPCEDLTS